MANELVFKKRIWLTDKQRDQIVDRYRSGESPPEIAASLGVCANNIRNALRQREVVMRDRAAAQLVYTHWEAAFDHVNEESAYWIGFLFADGWIYRGRHGSPVIAVGLAARDTVHLKKLRTFLRAEHPLSNHRSTIRGRTHAGTRLAIRSHRIADALAKHGMNSKSLGRVATKELADSRDFWRGAVDGDGYISGTKEVPRLGFCGGHALVRQFLDYLQSNDLAFQTAPRKQGRIYRVDLTKTTALHAIELLYKNATVVLDRKARRASFLLSTRRSIGR